MSDKLGVSFSLFSFFSSSSSSSFVFSLLSFDRFYMSHKKLLAMNKIHYLQVCVPFNDFVFDCSLPPNIFI